MREYKDFVVAVTIAIILPVIFSGIYFAKVYAREDKATYVSLLDGINELIVFGEKEVNVENLVNDDTSYEFTVMYASGLEGSTNYVVSLKDLSCTNIALQDIEWRLYKFSEETRKYELYASKLFDDDDMSETIDRDFVLGSEHSIKLGDTNKYKLSLSINNTQNKDGKIKAKIIAR